MDCVDNAVPKTASFENRRMLTGFLAEYPRTYAGNALTHELIQREDGTLRVAFVETTLPKMPVLLCSDSLGEMQCCTGRISQTLLTGSHGFRLQCSIMVDTHTERFGFSLTLGGREHRIDFLPADEMVTVMRPGEFYQMGVGRCLLKNVDFSEMVQIDMLVVGNMLDMLVSDGRALAVRLTNTVEEGCVLEAYVRCGTVQWDACVIHTM